MEWAGKEVIEAGMRFSGSPFIPGLIPDGNRSLFLPDNAEAAPEIITLDDYVGGRKRIAEPDSVFLVLGRRYDNYLSMPPDALECAIHDMIPNELKARSMVRKMLPHSEMIHERSDKYGLNLLVFNTFGFLKGLDDYHPSSIAFFKVYDPKPSYLELEPRERRPMMSVKNAVEYSLMDFLPELLNKIGQKGYGTKIYVFITDNHTGLSTDDLFRKMLIEDPIIKALQKQYRNDPRIEFVTGKSLEKGVEILARGHYG